MIKLCHIFGQSISHILYHNFALHTGDNIYVVFSAITSRSISLPMSVFFPMVFMASRSISTSSA
jgi:hypothetical protein